MYRSVHNFDEYRIRGGRIMEDKIEIIISDFGMDEEGTLTEQNIADIKNDLQELSNDIDINVDDIGQGYNWQVICIFVAVMQFLSLGKNLNDALDGWHGLAKKFVRVFAYFKKKHIEVLTSRNGAKLIALEYVFKLEEEIQIIDEFAENTVNLYGSKGSRKTELASMPINIYTFYFTVNSIFLYIIGVKSDGNIEFSSKVDLSRYWS